jgi:hypothetical protein
LGASLYSITDEGSDSEEPVYSVKGFEEDNKLSDADDWAELASDYGIDADTNYIYEF